MHVLTKVYLPIILFVFCGLGALGQSNPAHEGMEKVQALIKKNKVDAAEEKLADLLKEHPWYGDGWDLLVDIRYYQFKQLEKAPDLLGGKITVVTKDENGNEVSSENDTLANRLMEMLNNMAPHKQAYSKYVYTLRKATLFSNSAYRSSVGVRNLFHEPKVDTLVNAKALKYYNKGEEEFSAKNYNKAANAYKRAIEEQPDFYKAQLYLGDAFFFMGYYLEAIKHFKACAAMYPHLLEPRKYLIDSYRKEGLPDTALVHAVASMLVYPDQTNYARLEDLVDATHRKIAVEWQPRPVFPNRMKQQADIATIGNYTETELEEPTGTWLAYAEAMPKLAPYCNSKGVVTTANELTTAKYLEVYSWEELLRNSKPEEFEQARKMQALGYLDCYALLTCFHDDLYDQYRHLVDNDSQRVLDYLNTVVIVKR